MKNIYEILSANGIEIPADKKADLDKEILANYKTVAEFDKTKEKLTSALEEAKTLKDQNTELEKLSGDAEAYKKKATEYEQKEQERLANESKAVADKELTDKILTTFGEHKFTSDYVKNGLISDIKTRISQDGTIGIEKVFEELTKDKEGIFVNPQAPLNLPKAGAGFNPKTDKETMDSIYATNPFYKK